LDLRRSVDIAVVSASAALVVENGEIAEARIAIGAAAPVPLRVPAAEEVLLGVPVSDLAGAVEQAARRCRLAADRRHPGGRRLPAGDGRRGRAPVPARDREPDH
jgi:CO/xanthine dehydrogenase FAD-binding subunit